MICPTCNTENRDDAKFCKVCGRSLATATVAALTQHAPAEAVPALAPEPAADAFEHIPQTPAEAREEDISQEATLIISPEKMMAFHQRLWRDSMEPLEPLAVSAPAREDKSDTSVPTSATATEQQATGESAASPSEQDELGPIPIPPPPPPPPPPPESLAAGETEMEVVPGEEMQHNGYLENAGYPEMERSTTMPDSFEQQYSEHPQQVDPPDQNQQANEGTTDENAQEGTPSMAPPSFSIIETGTTLRDRYEITALITDNGQEHVYQVIDHQGYQRCWNCRSENNTATDDFCSDCGASLLDIHYIMHEFSAEQSKEDTPVLQGNIVNTFVEQGRTYVIEQREAEHNTFPNGVHLLAASHSDAGNVRRSDPNEDSALVLQLQRIHESLSSPVGVYIVADGMGGHDNGQLASRMTINSIAQRMTRELLLAPLAGEKDGVPVSSPDDESLVALLHDAIEEANTALCEVNARNKTDMGSTLTGFMIVGQHAFIVNVGDSRTYMVRGGQLYQLTTDHSLVGQLVASGLIEPDDVYTHPQRSQIYRSLGDKPNTQIDIFKQQLLPGDKLLACCDGLWEMVHNPQIESVLNTAPDPQTACQQLIDFANDNGGEDNITAVIVYVQ
jgi:serine/threonine protein phosphatase PrpC